MKTARGTSRVPVIIIGIVVAALVAASAGYAVWTRMGTISVDSPLAIAWQHRLPDGSGWSPVGDDAIVTSARQQPDAAVTVRLIDLDTGTDRWEVQVDVPHEVRSVATFELPGTDTIALLAFIDDTPTRVTFLATADGAVRSTSVMPAAATIMSAPGSGTLYLLDLAEQTLTRVRPGSTDLRDTTWSVSVPPLEFGDTPIGIREVDGYARIEPTPLHSRTVPNPGFFLAASLDHGLQPEWAPWGPSSYTSEVAGGYLQSTYGVFAGETSYVMRDKKGNTLWESQDLGFPVVVGDGLYTFRDADANDELLLQRIDPRTGQGLWESPAVVDTSTRLESVHQEVYALALWGDTPTIRQLLPATGRWGRTTTLPEPNASAAERFRSTWLISYDAEEELRLMAVQDGDSAAIWERRYDGWARVQQVGNHLVITDHSGTRVGLLS